MRSRTRDGFSNRTFERVASYDVLPPIWSPCSLTRATVRLSPVQDLGAARSERPRPLIRDTRDESEERQLSAPSGRSQQPLVQRRSVIEAVIQPCRRISYDQGSAVCTLLPLAARTQSCLQLQSHAEEKTEELTFDSSQQTAKNGKEQPSLAEAREKPARGADGANVSGQREKAHCAFYGETVTRRP